MDTLGRRPKEKLRPRVDTPLRRWRLAKGWTQAQAAKEIKVKHAAFSRWEHGQRIPYRKLKDLRDLTGLSYEALLCPEDYLKANKDAIPEGIQPLHKTGGRPPKFARAM